MLEFVNEFFEFYQIRDKNVGLINRLNHILHKKLKSRMHHQVDHFILDSKGKIMYNITENDCRGRKGELVRFLLEVFRHIWFFQWSQLLS